MLFIKCFPYDCVTKLRDNWMFRALLRTMESFKSIDFDLAKQILISPPTHLCTDWVSFIRSWNYEIGVVHMCIYVFILFMYSYLFNSTKTQQSATHLHCVKSVQTRGYFWSAFSCIRTEYRDLWTKSLCSVRIQENMDQK